MTNIQIKPMSHSGMIIPERSRDIGDFLVGRLLPFRKKRMIGPFIFIDHMGPAEVGPGRYMDVGQHPHIGLATLTYLFEGEIEHRDGIGTVQRIIPGAVNWMTAGSGVTHTERTPADLREGNAFILHGYQIWVALPRDHEDMPPEFYHAPPEALPRWEENATSFTLIAGKAFGRVSPVPVYSEMFLLELHVAASGELDLGKGLYGEIGIILVEGKIKACDQPVETGSVLFSKSGETCKVRVEGEAHLLVFGGYPLQEARHIDWNFVSSDRENIKVAREAWKSRTFPMMEGESSYVPFPGSGKG